MTYKEYLLMKKKYMGTQSNNDNNIQNNTMYNIYPKIEEEKKQPVINKDEGKNKIRSKSKHDRIRNYYWGEENQDSKVPEETKEYKSTYETNYDENGNEVLNENLFRNRQTEFKAMRKTYTGKFLPKRDNQKNDIKADTMYNFNINNNKRLDFNSKGHRSYYGGFRKNNSKNNFNKKK